MSDPSGSWAGLWRPGVRRAFELSARAFSRVDMFTHCHAGTRGGVGRRIEELRNGVVALERSDPLETTTATSWTATRRSIRSALLEADPRQFLTWRPVMETMFVAFGRSTPSELRALRRTADWRDRWKPAVREDSVGCPFPCPLYPASSANLIHHAFHLMAFEFHSGERLSDFSHILEFGGGYGSLARLWKRLGFDGFYEIFDFPELGLLQRFYLASLHDAGDLDGREPGSGLRFSFESCPDRLALPGPGSSLFVALWSLSEAPLEVRERFVDVITRFSHILIAFQENYDGIDNARWFENLVARVGGRRWTLRPVVKADRSWYLLGGPPGT